MLITKLKLSNWCQHKDLTLNFTSGFNGILGINGSGKSNILEAIRFALTGKCLSTTQTQNITLGESHSIVEIELIHDNQAVTIKREIDQDAPSKHCLTINGKTVTKTKEITAELAAFFGVTDEFLLNHIIVSQGKIDRLISVSASDRTREFQDLFGTDYLEKLRDKLKDEKFLYPIVSNKTEIISLQDSVKAKEEFITSIKAELATFDSLDFSSLFNHIDTQINLHYKSKELAEQIVNIKTKIQNDNILILNYENEKSQLERDKLVIENELSTLFDNFVAEHSINPNQERILETSNLLKGYNEQEDKLTQEIERILKSIPPIPEYSKAEILVSIDTINNELFKIKEAETQLPLFVQGKCPTCHQLIPDSQSKKVTCEHLIANRRNLEASASILKSKLELADKYLVAKQSADNSIKQIKNQLIILNRAKQQINILEAKEIELIDSIKEYKNEQQKLNIRLEVIKTDLVNLSSKLITLITQRDMRSSQLLDLQTNLSALGTDYDEIKVKSLQQDKATLIELDKNRNKLLGQLSSESASLSEYKDNLTRLLKTQEITDSRAKYIKALEDVRTVLQKDCLPAIASRTYIANLNIQLSHYLEQAQTSFKSRLCDDFSFECVLDTGKIVPSTRLSGGQKIMLGISFCFSICRLFSKNLLFVVLDEPTVYLDHDNIDKLVAMLSNIKQEVVASDIQLIIVTHEERIRTILDNVIDLNKC